MKKIIFLTLILSTAIFGKENTNYYDEAIKYLKGEKVKKDIDKGVTLLLLSKERSNLKAYYTLGKIYLSKTTKYHDKTKAYNHFVFSANKGFAKSQNMLGKLFLFGITTEVDYEKAMYYFKKASKQRYYDANCFIAYMYASGKGVFPNFGRAHVFAKDEYKKGNKLCMRVWRDYNLGKYPKDEGFKVGEYLKPIK